MKLLIIIPLFLFFSSTQAQWEIRGSDNICGSVTYQLYYNGTLNTQPILWESISRNPNNIVTLSNRSNSSVTITLNQLTTTGCSPNPTNPICCYPPAISLFVKNSTTNQLIFARTDILLSCGTFPISGLNILPYGITTTYQMQGTITSNGRNCCGGNSLWVVSDNLLITDPFWITSNRITIQRIGPGQAYLDFYFCDGLAYRKTIQ